MLFMSCVCHVFLYLFIAALWSPAGKGLTAWPMFVMSYCNFVIFQCGIQGQMRYLIVLIPDLCRLPYRNYILKRMIGMIDVPVFVVAPEILVQMYDRKEAIVYLLLEIEQ